jgi:hypothetical protein
MLCPHPHLYPQPVHLCSASRLRKHKEGHRLKLGRSGVSGPGVVWLGKINRDGSNRKWSCPLLPRGSEMAIDDRNGLWFLQENHTEGTGLSETGGSGTRGAELVYFC